MIKSTVASAKVILVFFIHLHTVKIRETKNVRKITKRGKMSLLLNKCRNF